VVSFLLVFPPKPYKTSDHTLSLHRLTSNSSSTTNFRVYLLPTTDLILLHSVVRRCIPILVCILLLSHTRTCYMPCPPHLLGLDHCHYILRGFQVGRLLIMQCYLVSYYIIPPCSQKPSVYILPLLRDQNSYPLKTTGKIMVFYILIFTFLDNRREDRQLRTQW
jgi:hypothetical protein